MMFQPTLLRRFARAALMLVLCIGGWIRADAAASAGPARGAVAAAHASVVRAVIVDFDGDGDSDRVTLHADQGIHVWLNDGRGRYAPLAVADAPLWEARDLKVTLDEPSTTDNSDQSDATAHIEPRAGPVALQPSRSLQPCSSTAPRSQHFSSSTPRAPPVSLRLA